MLSLVPSYHSCLCGNYFKCIIILQWLTFYIYSEVVDVSSKIENQSVN